MLLNPQLYRSLTRAFGSVYIAKEGESAHWVTKPSLATGRVYAQITEGRGGEEYRVNCPFCGDTRHRLYINHTWNTTDAVTGTYFGRGRFCCFNDGCPANRDAPIAERQECGDELVERLKAYIARGRGLTTVQPTAEAKLRPIVLPEKYVPLDALPADHAAIQYLRDERGFDPYQLSRDWRVGFCVDDPNEYVAGRLIIPVHMDGMLVGWQARYVGEPPSNNIPKYFTGPGTLRNRLLYNLDRAKFSKYGVLVEGPTDAWRVGTSAAVAALGSSVSFVQIQLMKLAWGAEGGVVVMLDPEYAKKLRRRPNTPTAYEQLMEQLRDPTAFKHGVVEVILPDGTDPGKLTTPQLWGHIRRAAAVRGFLLD